MPNLHTRIKKHRKKLGLSQSDMASQCGVSQPTIANWERGGHIPRQDALTKIANCLGVDSVWLLSGKLPIDRTPSYQYLNTPIRHIPVFEWHNNARVFAKASPHRYVTLSVDNEDVFGITISEANISAARGFDSGTTLFFDRRAKLAANTRFLANAAGRLVLVDASNIEHSKLIPIARLILSMRSH